MSKNFGTETDALFAKITIDNLAAEIGCSVGSVKQARMDPSSPSYRSAPPGWEKAAARLATQRAAYFTKLAKRLSQD